MAPELTTNQLHNEKIDVYSFGILIYELITGERPFDGLSGFALLEKVRNGVRPNIDIFQKKHPQVAILAQQCWSSSATLRPSFNNITKKLQIEL